ncbi:hypothetical protein K450DRAFT_257799 [Umbelopsis ramanniana AG]|uniref:Uncharacterized protein n=1 Tax=Umbelopsis ramanniana AG TaxID=1314678 RepID=A0AAD5HB81_UMBRA|nr:uncharacterized protein K450DRAFT_257799 [Umbelopsis ramanniana AG]KAI8576241.1 hypothetical protein K450DRAFT_257799 [Umbelopsis ramanniana AG]
MLDSDRFDEASANIGTYMLQGWILTDEQCPQPQCPTPLLRSKDGKQKICVVHNLPGKSAPKDNFEQSGFKQATANEPLDRSMDDTAHQIDIEEDDEADEFIRRVNEGSKHDGSVAVKRREQSKLASERIGQKLLQQWTLVNDICPSDTCYAVPLVRDQQQRLFCVICERSYMNENTYLQSVRKREIESDTPKANVEQPPAPKPSKCLNCTCKRRKISIDSAVDLAEAEHNGNTIMQDVNLRDFDYDLEDPNFLSSQLQMLKPNTQIDAPQPPAAINNDDTSSYLSARSSLLDGLKQKVDKLSQDVISIHDPVAMVKLFEAIKSGSEAIEAYQRIC